MGRFGNSKNEIANDCSESSMLIDVCADSFYNTKWSQFRGIDRLCSSMVMKLIPTINVNNN